MPYLYRTPVQRSLPHVAARLSALLLAAGAGYACAEDDAAEPRTATVSEQALRAVIGPDGGELVGERGSEFDGVRVVIPEGALEVETEIAVVRMAEGEHELPETATPCGPMFAIEPAGLTLAEPAEITLPFDEAVVTDELRFADQVKVWVSEEDGWGRELQVASSSQTVTIELGALTTVAAGVNPPKPEEIVSFAFTPLAQFERCMAQYPDDPKRRPTVEALVVPGEGNDAMFIHGRYLKPGIGFDLFSLERSLLGADGERDPEFRGFGLAWYQTDLEANRWGRVRQVVRTVLLDEAFGLDSDVELAPTRTFHAGFWFTDPKAAADCGFDPTRPTPFNGEQKAGPLAMTTLPDADTGLGPLCTDADTCLK